MGSLYHRFGSRAHILARLWLRIAARFQKEFFRALESGDPVEAALFTTRWCRVHLNEAQALLLYRREELADSEWPKDILEAARKLGEELVDAMRRFTERQFGSTSDEYLRKARFAVIDIPAAAVLRHLRAGEPPPQYVDDLVKQACGAILEES